MKTNLQDSGKHPLRRTPVVFGAVVAMAMALSCGSEPSAQQPVDADPAVHMLEQASQAFTRVARQATPAVVFIQVEKTVETPGRPGQFQDPLDFFGDDFFRRFFGDPRMPRGGQAPRQQRQVGQGSGFIVTRDGYILTNNHVVGGADKMTVRLQDGREFEASLVGADPQSEVAVIKIDAGDEDLPTVAMGDSDILEIGEWVIAIGNPFGLSETLTVGVVSAKGRSGIGLADYEDFIQTDAAINPGNSGGPLLNIKGEVIGINTAIFTRSGGYMGIGFAVPINMARAIKRQLVETGEVVRGHLGIVIQEMTRELAESFGLETPRGILVGDVVDGSPAEEHGLKQGDILLRVDGDEIVNVASFRNRIALTAPGTTVRLTVFRDGEQQDIDIVMGSLDDAPLADSQAVERWKEVLGFVVQDVDAAVEERTGFKPRSGVLVSEVVPYSPAARVGIRPGHMIVSVNRRKVPTPQDFYQQLTQAEGTVLLQVSDGRHSRFVAIRLP